MSTLTWLHLSDLHACHPKFAWDAGRVTETLVRDLEHLRDEHGLRPDLLFFTGDAAFGEIGSQPGETLRGQLDLFATLLDRVRAVFKPEIALENVFLVPGNHDVHRGWVADDQTEWLDSRLEKQDGLDPVREMVAAGNLQWRRYMERLRDYRSFLEERKLDHLLDDPERLIYAATREVDGVTVGIAGFNSAWSCCRDAERGRLWMAGQWQQGVLRTKLAAADFSVALVHHPPDWLVEYENPDFGRGLEHDFRFLLHGHEHRAWVQSTADGYSVVAAGACYERSESKHNGYNVVRLDLQRGRGEVWLRGYDAEGGGWIARQVFGKSDPKGVWKLSLPWWTARRKATRTASPASAAPPASGNSEPETPAVVSPLARYLQRLRAAHRDLPIAGFETRVRLPIHLDEVYIPLRARAVRDFKEYGALRELETDAERARDVAFDAALELAAEHGLRGAVVLGDPGSGKTTLLKHFVLASTDPSIGPATLGLPGDTIPVLVELRRVSDPTAGLEAAVEGAVASADVAADAGSLARELLGRDRLLVLVDGLDEVADVADRAAVSSWLENALRQLPESTFVVSSRYAGYRGDARLSGRFLELHVRDVEEEAARRFLRAWYGAVEAQAELGRDTEVAEAIAEEAATALAEKIFEPEDPRTSSLKQLATNPLMLQILCLVHRDRKHLPERRVELYRECVLVLLELWRRAKGIPVDLDSRQALRLLRPLAYRLHAAELREAPLAELLPHLAEPLRELRRPPEEGVALLETIRDQSGVLVSLGQSRYGFLHLSFQEYLCALHVQDRSMSDPALLGELAEHFGEPWWREVILLSLGLDAPSLFAPLMAEIVKQGALVRDAQLADDCLRDALAATPRPFLEALDHGLDGAGERFHALRLLKALPGWESETVRDERTGKELIERLAREDPDRQVRGMAVELLGGGDVEAPATPGEIVSPVRERRHETDGSILVYVPGGEFTLGAEDLVRPQHWPEESVDWPKPVHRVVLSPFWIGKYPVTNAHFGRFLEAHDDHPKPELWDDKEFNQPEQPVVGVSWLDALAYCRWAGLELPSEAQWEAAARGRDARRFPWGNEAPTPALANYGGQTGRPTPVGSHPEGAGPYGTLDQAGNVWEWCRDLWDPKAYEKRDGRHDPVVEGAEDDRGAVRVLRGGSWAFPAGFLPAALRFRGVARFRNGLFGFRVVCRSGPEHGD